MHLCASVNVHKMRSSPQERHRAKTMRYPRRAESITVALICSLYNADPISSFQMPIRSLARGVGKGPTASPRRQIISSPALKEANDDSSISISNEAIDLFSDETTLFNPPSTLAPETLAGISGLENTTVETLTAEWISRDTSAVSDFTSTDLNAETASETEMESSLEAPDVKKVLRFAIPAVGVWLCSPLLSLIDTSAVGLLSGTAQQAALNPAVAVTDYGSLLVAFVYTATTNLVATANEKDRNVEGKPQTTKTLTAALQLASLVGIVFGAFFGIFSKFFMKALIGNDAIDPVVFAAALRYVRIRALGLPAAVVIGSAQAACLGLQDIKSPLYVLLAAAVVNFFGDLVFVGSSNPLIGGCAGAAWATVFSQYAALVMFLGWLQRKPKASSSNNTSGTLITRGILSGKFRKRDIFKLPPLEKAKQFWPYVIPVTTTAIGRVSGYIAMSHVASSTLGMTDMAAQQILLAFFMCFTPICDSLNLTAQSFVPGIFERKPSLARTNALKHTVKSFVKAGIIMGTGLLGMVSCMPVFSKFFTLDALVSSKVASATPFLAAIFALSGIVCAGEGLLLGQKDLGFLGKSYAAYFFAVPFFLLRLKKVAASGIHNVGVSSMWQIFTVYQSIRCAMWLIRLRLLHRQRRASQPVGAVAV